MNHTWVAALQSRARQRLALELSAYDLADDDNWLDGPKGGQYKMVGGKKVYKKKGAGGGRKKAAAPQPGQKQPKAPKAAAAGSKKAGGGSKKAESKPFEQKPPQANPGPSRREIQEARDDASWKAKRDSKPASLDLMPETLAAAGEREWGKIMSRVADGNPAWSSEQDLYAYRNIKDLADGAPHKLHPVTLIRMSVQAAAKAAAAGKGKLSENLRGQVAKLFGAEGGDVDTIVSAITRLARYL